MYSSYRIAWSMRWEGSMDQRVWTRGPWYEPTQWVVWTPYLESHRVMQRPRSQIEIHAVIHFHSLNNYRPNGFIQYFTCKVLCLVSLLGLASLVAPPK